MKAHWQLSLDFHVYAVSKAVSGFNSAARRDKWGGQGVGPVESPGCLFAKVTDGDYDEAGGGSDGGRAAFRACAEIHHR